MEKKNDRVLAYKLAKEINLEDTASIAGGRGSGGWPETWHITYSISGIPSGPPAFDVAYDN